MIFIFINSKTDAIGAIDFKDFQPDNHRFNCNYSQGDVDDENKSAFNQPKKLFEFYLKQGEIKSAPQNSSSSNVGNSEMSSVSIVSERIIDNSKVNIYIFLMRNNVRHRSFFPINNRWRKQQMI